MPFLLATSLASTSALYAAEAPIVGDPTAGGQKIKVCTTCHSQDGNSVIPTNPSLAGQHEEYLVHALTEYQKGPSGTRNNPIMMGMAANLSAQDIADIAAYYSSQQHKIGEADPALVARGEALYRGGDASKGIPACMACHGPTGSGNGPAKIPAIAGQHPDYFVASLKEYQIGNRQNVMMDAIANKMSDADMQAVASYVYGLYPTGTQPVEETPATTSTAATKTTTSSAKNTTSTTTKK